MSERRFKVALSFPRQKRKFVSKVAEELSKRLGREKVLYDKYLEPDLARPNLNVFLGNLYREHSDLVVPFFCADYKERKWCRLEWRHMQVILFDMEDDRIMPFRFDDTEIPGLLPTDGYIKIGSQTPKQVAELILKRLEIPPADMKSAEEDTPKRKLWIWGLLAIPVLLFAIFLAFNHSPSPKPFPADVTGILILRLPGDNDNSLRSRLLYSLDDAIKNDSHDKKIQTQLCDEIVDENKDPANAHERAREIGKKWNAQLVVWGNKADALRFYPRITTVRSVKLPAERTFKVQDLRELDFPPETINKPVYLAHFVAGMSLSIQKQQELALKHFKAAKDLNEATPEELAILNLAMGSIHSELAKKGPASYLRVAIDELSAAASYYEKAGNQRMTIAFFAMSELELLEIYRTIGTSQNLLHTILDCQKAIKNCQLSNLTLLWAFGSDELGVAYTELRTGDKTENVKHAINAYYDALSVFTKDFYPDRWAQTKSDLSYAYTILPDGNRDQNLQQAVAICKSVLAVISEKNFPMRWASLQYSLGYAYSEFSGEYMSKAIQCFIESSRVFQAIGAPFEWAQAEGMLGFAYVNLATGDRASNLKKAIDAEQQALKVFTKADYPLEWARTQGTLADAYVNLPDGAGRTNALSHYNAALEILNKDEYPIDWATVQLDLSSFYLALASDGDKEKAHLAVESAQAALTVFNEKDCPDQWAECEMQLGFAYNRVRQFQNAIICLNAASSKIDQFRSPLKWASVEYSLGAAYANLPIPANVRLANLIIAKSHVSNALKIWTPEGFPEQYEQAHHFLESADQEIKKLREQMGDMTSQQP